MVRTKLKLLCLVVYYNNICVIIERVTENSDKIVCELTC